MRDVLAILRIMNLDMQMATDAYNYANRRRDVDAESEVNAAGDGIAREIAEILATDADRGR